MSHTLPEQATPPLNEVRLRGRVSSVPQARELPSGASIVSLRITVTRSPTPMTKGSKQSSDWLECTGWSASVRRSMLAWRVGDTVEVEGALRRRFYRGTSQPGTRVEIEALSVRRVAKVGSARDAAAS